MMGTNIEILVHFIPGEINISIKRILMLLYLKYLRLTKKVCVNTVSKILNICYCNRIIICRLF